MTRTEVTRTDVTKTSHFNRYHNPTRLVKLPADDHTRRARTASDPVAVARDRQLELVQRWAPSTLALVHGGLPSDLPPILAAVPLDVRDDVPGLCPLP